MRAFAAGDTALLTSGFYLPGLRPHEIYTVSAVGLHNSIQIQEDPTDRWFNPNHFRHLTPHEKAIYQMQQAARASE